MPRRRQVLVESSDEEEMSQTQSFSQPSTSAGLTREEKTVFAGKVANYILQNECKKIPSKMGDIRKLILKDKAKHFNEVMEETKQMMQDVYAYKIMEMKGKDQKMIKQYILVNTLNSGDDVSVNSVIHSDEVRGLLTIVLIGIFMSGGVMHEGPMREYLRNFEIDLDTKAPHPVFGIVDRLIHQELYKQKYINISYDKSVDPPAVEYRWGQRAHHELSKKQVLELVCKIYGDTMQPNDWELQWRQIEKEGST